MVPRDEGQVVGQGPAAASPTEQRIYEGAAQTAPAEMPGVVEGRIVHYVLQDGSHRPAIVVLNWHEPSGSCNLQVLVDGLNDKRSETGLSAEECDRGMAWKTSVRHSAEPQPHTWHWIEKA